MNRLSSSAMAVALVAVPLLRAQTPLGACGYHNVNLVMEQVPSTWWDWQPNNDTMWLWNQYVDLYRYTASNGTWGHNGTDEFAGFPSSADLNNQWGFTWGPGTLALTVYSWNCACCRLLESDVAFNPSTSWTTDAVFAETSTSVVYYPSVVQHELGHSWGEQTQNENYDYAVPSVMHAYYSQMVHPGTTIHAPDAYLIRQIYQNQTAPLPRADMAVFSHRAVTGLLNTTTGSSHVAQGAQLTVNGITVENTGTSATANAHIRLYLSTNRTISTGDWQIGDWFWTSFGAESWGSYNLTGTVPINVPTGAYWVGAIVTSNGYGGDDLGANDTTYLYSQIVVDPYPCTDDALEPNNSQAGARTVAAGFHGGLQVCQGNDDWYRVVVPGGNRLTVSIQFAHANGDLDLGLYDAAGTLIDTSYSVTDGESVRLANAPATGSWYARVFGFAGAQNAYSLQVDVEPNATCTFRNGNGVNPSGYVCNTNPVLGAVWQSSMPTNGTTAATYIAVGSTANAGAPFFSGQLLVDNVFELFTSATGSHAIQVPSSTTFLGARFYSQGFRLDAPGGQATIVPLNAQDLLCGR